MPCGIAALKLRRRPSGSLVTDVGERLVSAPELQTHLIHKDGGDGRLVPDERFVDPTVVAAQPPDVTDSVRMVVVAVPSECTLPEARSPYALACPSFAHIRRRTRRRRCVCLSHRD